MWVSREPRALWLSPLESLCVTVLRVQAASLEYELLKVSVAKLSKPIWTHTVTGLSW